MEVPTAVLERLREYDTPTIANALEGLGLTPSEIRYTDPSIRCLLPELPRFVAFAATAMIRTRQQPADGSAKRLGYVRLYEHVRSVPAPRIVVVQDIDGPLSAGCLWGEVNATIFRALGCEGVLTDGVVRDLPEVREIGFRYYARAVGVSHAWVRVEDVGREVVVGGLAVSPGDLLHGDEHGVVRIPAELASTIAGAADAVIEREQSLLAWVRSDAFDPDELPTRRVVH